MTAEASIIPTSVASQAVRPNLRVGPGPWLGSLIAVPPLLAVFLGFITPSSRAAEADQEKQFADDIRPVLVEYCGDCHKKNKEVPFLAVTDLAGLGAKRHLWRSVVTQLKHRTMPPPEEDQPEEADRIRIATWLDRALRESARQAGDFAGVAPPRRLNRLEYDNTIRDLLGLKLNFSETFPTDGGGGEGFNNNGETLFLPVILMERYLEAAEQILDAAIVSPPWAQHFGPRDFSAAVPPPGGGAVIMAKGDELSVTAGILINRDYTLAVTAAGQSDAPASIVLKLDGIPAFRFTPTPGAAQPKATTIHLARGPHTISVQCEEGAAEVAGLDLREISPAPSAAKRAAHARLFGARDVTALAQLAAPARRDEARAIIGDFTRQAFRRPVAATELERLLSLYDRSADRGDPFTESVKLALKAVLVSPHFLFRVESDREAPGIFPLDGYELASRLSYFFWASMPDPELMQLADRGQLNEPAILSAQVDRMLADPKARAFVEDFTGQWLGTREVGASVSFTTEKMKGIYSTELAADLREEAVQMMQYIIAEDRSLLDLLDSDYTFLSERIAKHYDISGVTGSEFRKVTLTDHHRGGVIGLGAVHMLTAYPDRTSPVLRGAWVLDTLLGASVPPPPPGVPPLEATAKKTKGASLREQLEQHRSKPECAACHNVMDPIGFGMENYDLLGRWRDQDRDKPIDASGVMPSGEAFNGPGELRQVLLTRKGEFTRHFTGKVLGYALGRSLEDRDDGTIEKIADELEHNGYHARTLLRAIVLSTPFRNIQGGETAPVAPAPAPRQKKKVNP